MMRLQRYTKDEKDAHERWSESCRMTPRARCPHVLAALAAAAPRPGAGSPTGSTPSTTRWSG